MLLSQTTSLLPHRTATSFSQLIAETPSQVRASDLRGGRSSGFSPASRHFSMQTPECGTMFSAFKLSTGYKNDPIELSDDEGQASQSTLRSSIGGSRISRHDVIDLTVPSNFRGKKRRRDEQCDESLTAATVHGSTRTQATMMPTTSDERSFRTSVHGSTRTKARRIFNTSGERSFRTSRVNDAIDDDAEDQDDNELDLARELDVQEVNNFRRAQNLQRGLPRGHRFQNSAIAPSGVIVTPGTNVQLFRKNKVEIQRFLRVKHIIMDGKGEVWLRGILMKRNTDIYYHRSTESGEVLLTILPNKTNDLCMHLLGDPAKIESSLDNDGLALIHLNEVKKVREIFFTNRRFEDFSYMDRGMSVNVDTLEKVRQRGILCCRWKYVEEVKGKYGIPSLVASLSQAECDKTMGVPDAMRIRGYGSEARPNESTWEDDLVDLTIDPTKTKKRRYEATVHRKANASSSTSTFEQRTRDTSRRNFSSISHLLPRPQQSTNSTSRRRRRKYTHGEICAGLGGTLRGAEKAGFVLDWALDKWDVAVRSLLRNWPQLRRRILKLSIQDFVVKIQTDNNYRVDVIHISFPCQGHSWQNRGQNPEQDALNNETIITLTEILKHLRPRVVTLEQTDGILTKNEGFWFRAVISQLTCAGYSARCKVFNMADYGLCQARKRLIVVAACPGQKLPKWPAPTHGDGPGLRERVTLGQAIRNIPDWATAHDIAHHKHRVRRNLPTADMNAPLRQLIDTSGAKCLIRDTDGFFYWPTFRQQMRVQGFPDEHEITGSIQDDFTTQIGNAVPPLFAKPVFEEIIKALEASDREVEEWSQEIVLV